MKRTWCLLRSPFAHLHLCDVESCRFDDPVETIEQIDSQSHTKSVTSIVRLCRRHRILMFGKLRGERAWETRRFNAAQTTIPATLESHGVDEPR